MITTYIGEGPFLEFNLEGHVLSLGEKEINLQGIQENYQRIVDLVEDDLQVASVYIPPYTLVDTEEFDEETQETFIHKIPGPVDTEKVQLTLWTIPKQPEQENE